MLPLTVFVKPARHYVSMRVHGTSVHVNRGDPPDSPAKVLDGGTAGPRDARQRELDVSRWPHTTQSPTPLEVLDTFRIFRERLDGNEKSATYRLVTSSRAPQSGSRRWSLKHLSESLKMSSVCWKM